MTSRLTAETDNVLFVCTWSFRVPCFVLQSGNTDSLSVSFQLADLKEGHEVVFGVTGSRGGASQGAELRGRHWRKEEQADEWVTE